MSTCVHCQNELPDGAMHCVHCGQKQPAPVAPDSKKTIMGYPGVAAAALARAGAPGAAAAAPPPAQPAAVGGPPPAQPAPVGGPPPAQPAPVGGPPPARPVAPGPGPSTGEFGGSAALGASGPSAGAASSSEARTVFAGPAVDAGGGTPPGAPPPMAGGAPPVAAGYAGGPPPAAAGYAGGPPPQPAPRGAPYSGGAPAPGVPPTSQVAPLRPPYLASETGTRVNAPVEPWAGALRTLMVVFGVVLIACFVAPWAIVSGHMAFAWDALTGHVGTYQKLTVILIAGTGILAVVLGSLPLAAMGRGVGAAALGLAPILYHVLGASGGPAWRPTVLVLGGVALVAGLVVRSQYRSSLAARVLVTVGAIVVLSAYLVPAGGAVPLVALFKAIGSAPGRAKVAVIVQIVPVLLVLASLLVWLPSPTSAGAAFLAWIMIVWPVVAALAKIGLTPHALDALKASLSKMLYTPLTATAWTALAGYGIAAVMGKQLEHS